MGVLKLKLTTGRSTTQLTAMFETPTAPKAVSQKCADFITSISTGTELAQGTGVPPSINIIVQGNEAYAATTLTGSSVVATNTIVINGVTFTAEASGATGNQFNVGASDTLTMAAAAAAINASVTALVAGYVVATSVGAVLTLTSAFPGPSGNQCTVTAGGGTITVANARLVGGAVDATAQTFNF